MLLSHGELFGGAGIVHGRGFDGNQHLTRAGLRRRNVLDCQIFHLSPGSTDHGAHRLASPV
jgi:hypothetical protein